MLHFRTIAALGLAAGFLSAAKAAEAAPPVSAADAMVQVLEKVCRPAHDTQTSPGNFASEGGLTAEPNAPQNLPMGIAGLSTWRAPTPEGKLYVMSGVFPESTTPATCLVALYDADNAPVSKAVGDYVFGLKRGFVQNPRYNFVANGWKLTRYDRRTGDTIHSVIVMDAVAPKPGQPTEVFAAFEVDQGWMLHPGQAKQP